MTTTPPSGDPTMAAITAAVERGQAGEIDRARGDLTELWTTIGPAGDAFHRCTLAHFLADLQPDPAQALVWDIRALDAAETLTDARVRDYHDDLRIAGFHPSLRLNIADNFRRLGSFDAAADQLEAARQQLGALADDAYGRGIRQAIDDSADMIARRSTARRESAPGVTS
ncbi:hypothetical protein NONO_c69240 [Nocardia nova SH22a]|uniref:Tetratricopeptide repeat-containing protein n=1 Tax=Nocardia nova SH22a TaxID=1415166 RepID=W5TR96_9NOCA|nr:hypothetical protein [Nocardia nova]AHH21689.1 hypothetical protein NONO_c69240 [Nocardia nova SH22a]